MYRLATMLVRSSSTPVLGVLFPSGSHWPAVSSPAVHFHESPAAAAYHQLPISCHLGGPGSGSDHERLRGPGAGVRRTCSEDNLASQAGVRADDLKQLHHLPPPSGKGAPRAQPVPLETIQSFGGRQEEEEEDAYEVERELRFGQFNFAGGSTYSQEHPMFLARGLGIDRLGSGLLSTDGGFGGSDGGGGAGFGGSDGGGGAGFDAERTRRQRRSTRTTTCP